MSDRNPGSRPDTLERLVAYSAAAGLGAFAFGQEAGAIIVHTDIPDLQINRSDPGFDIDFDNDGYLDATLLNTAGGGFGYGTVQWRGSLETQGLPGSDRDTFPQGNRIAVQFWLHIGATNGDQRVGI